MKKILIGENIIKSFGEGNEERKVLDHVSVEIREGEFVSVMGPSGSGKSTLIFALSGMDSIDSGKAVFAGRDLAGLKEKELADVRRKRMGFVFQQPTMLKHLNLLDNIILPSMRDGRKDVVKLTAKAMELMKKTGISELAGRDITQVSGGQLQRAGICRTLMNSPQIIFADEPTGSLNSKAAQEVMDIFSEINAKGTAIMIVTHDSRVAARTERVMFMTDGRIVNELNLPIANGTDMDGRVQQVMEKMRMIGI